MEEPLERGAHSFVVRIWRERQGYGGRKVTWRGRITHAASGNQRALHALGDIAAFIEPYLVQLGVAPSLRLRLQHWIHRWCGPLL